MWLGVAFWTGGAWIMYFADAPTITRAFWTGTAPVPVYFFVGLFAFTTYALAGWAREQVCTYMCPWPRFQSAMLDDQSLTVTYQAWRGEPRARGKRAPDAPPAGDCIDCAACYTACPTGIDIRDGIQLECINCGLCIDACNHVMERTGRPPWLITWDTLADQKAKEEGRAATFRWLRPRTTIYLGALLVAGMVMVAALATRTTLALEVQHDRAPVFVPLPDGGLRNGYTIEITNRTQRAAAFTLSVSGIKGARLADAAATRELVPSLTLNVGPDQIGTFRVLVTARPAALPGGHAHLDFMLRNPDTRAETVYRAEFFGPTGYQGGQP